MMILPVLWMLIYTFPTGNTLDASIQAGHPVLRYNGEYGTAFWDYYPETHRLEWFLTFGKTYQEVPVYSTDIHGNLSKQDASRLMAKITDDERLAVEWQLKTWFRAG